MVAAFSGENIIQDFNSIESELILADLQLVQNRIERINKERKGRPQKEEDPELILLQRISRVLEEERFAKDLGLSVEEVKMLAGFQLLTLKPMIVILNVSEDKMNKPNTDLEQHIKSRNLIFFSLCAKLEAEIEELPQEEQPQFLQEMGLDSLSREKFMQICFQAFDFISFFTVVGKEARAWPIPRSSTALKAAGSVHSDMEKGFIRAEVINFKDFIECGSFAKAKENGLLRLESKEYPVQDGDIINFKFSV